MSQGIRCTSSKGLRRAGSAIPADSGTVDSGAADTGADSPAELPLDEVDGELAHHRERLRALAEAQARSSGQLADLLVVLMDARRRCESLLERVAEVRRRQERERNRPPAS